MQNLLEFLELDYFTLDCKIFEFLGDDELGFAKNSRIDSFIELALEKCFFLLYRNEISITFSKDEKFCLK